MILPAFETKKNLRLWRRFSQQKDPRIFYVSFSVQMVSVLSPKVTHKLLVYMSLSLHCPI